MYTVEQIAEELGVSVKSVRGKLAKYGLKNKKVVEGVYYYSRMQLEFLKENHIVYAYFESKINTDGN